MPVLLVAAPFSVGRSATIGGAIGDSVILESALGSDVAAITRRSRRDVGGIAFDQRRLIGAAVDLTQRPQRSVKAVQRHSAHRLIRRITTKLASIMLHCHRKDISHGSPFFARLLSRLIDVTHDDPFERHRIGVSGAELAVHRLSQSIGLAPEQFGRYVDIAAGRFHSIEDLLRVGIDMMHNT